jgi:hypothetical protein
MHPSTEQEVTTTEQKVPPTAQKLPTAERKVSPASRKVPNPHKPEFDVLLRIYIDEDMHASLSRLGRYFKKREGLMGREILHQYLMANDPQYKQQLLNSIDMNDKNRE